MSKSRAVHYLLCLILFVSVLSGLAGDRVALAARESSNGSFLLSPNQEQPPFEEKLSVMCKYPVLKGKSGDSFEFSAELWWTSSEFRQFNVTATGPPKWSISILGGYEKKEIYGRIGLKPLEPGKTYPIETITVRFAPVPGELPKPGDYVITLEVSSGDIKETVELKAVVTALYGFGFYTGTGRLNTEVTTGEDNHLPVWLVNTGSATIEDIALASSKPEGWGITFNPGKVESLEPGLMQEVDVVIKPPSKTIAGDYLVTLYARSAEFSPDPLQLRVTVLTPTIWGWVGILIVLAVIAGLGVIFRRLGRR